MDKKKPKKEKVYSIEDEPKIETTDADIVGDHPKPGKEEKQ